MAIGFKRPRKTSSRLYTPILERGAVFGFEMDHHGVQSAHASLDDGNAFDAVTWTPANITVTANNTTAPDGSGSADLIASTSTTTPNILQTFSATNPGRTVYELYVKQSSSVDWVSIDTNANLNSWRTWFNISTGTVGTSGANHAEPSIVDVGNGWWKLNVTSLAAVNFRLRLTNGDASLTGVGAGSVWAWGASITRIRCISFKNIVSGVTWNADATLANQPQINLAGFNGRSALEFWGAHWIISGEAAVAAAVAGEDAQFTCYMLVRPFDGTQAWFGMGNTGTANTDTLYFGSNSGGTGLYRCIKNATSGGVVTGAGNAWTGGNSLSLANRGLLTRWVCQGTILNTFENGIDVTSASSFDTGTITTNQTAIGARPDSGPDTAATSGTTIRAIWLFNVAHTAQESKRVEAYLARYGNTAYTPQIELTPVPPPIPTTDAIVQYLIDESSGTTVNDTGVGSPLNLTTTDDPTFGSSGFGTQLNFTANDAAHSVAVQGTKLQTALDGSRTATFEFVYNFTASSDFGAILFGTEFIDSDNDNFSIYGYRSGSDLFCEVWIKFQETGNSNQHLTYTLPAGRHHVCLTLDTNEVDGNEILILYVDGSRVTNGGGITQNWTLDIPATPDVRIAMARGYHFDTFLGGICYAAIHGTTLSSTDVANRSTALLANDDVNVE